MSIMEGMNKRTTIADVAREAGVSISTVNRILSGGGGVRHATIQSVQDAAERVGYYGVGAIAARKHDSLPRYRLGFLLQQSTRAVYRLIADQIMKGEINEIKETMKRSREVGMQTFDQALFDAFEARLISYEEALRNADSQNDLKLNIKLNSQRARSADLSAGTEHLTLV